MTRPAADLGRDQGRPEPDRAGHHEPGRQQPRRDAAGRHAHHRDGERQLDEQAARAAPRPEGRRLRRADGDRHRLRDGPRDALAPVRTVLHHQGAGQGHRAGPVDDLRHRQAERRLHLGRAAKSGRGTTFRIYLPRIDERGTRGAREDATPSAARIRDDPARRGRGGGAAPPARHPAALRLHGARGRERPAGDPGRRTPRRPDPPGGHRHGDAADERVGGGRRGVRPASGPASSTCPATSSTSSSSSACSNPASPSSASRSRPETLGRKVREVLDGRPRQ